MMGSSFGANAGRTRESATIAARYAPSTVAATPHALRHRGTRQRRVFPHARRDSRCIKPSP
jgi:hypothetical protein